MTTKPLVCVASSKLPHLNDPPRWHGCHPLPLSKGVWQRQGNIKLIHLASLPSLMGWFLFLEISPCLLELRINIRRQISDMTERAPDAMHQIDIVFPHGTNVDLEPDEDIDDAEMQSLGGSDVDSALGESEAWPSSTASLRSSIVRAREENGRIYHGYKDGKYVLPTDQVCMCMADEAP
ncbi:hypothetical protein CaCOL14_008708 [Colletotrichum acutatum]